MIIILKDHATDEQIEHVVERVESQGLKAHLSRGTYRTVIGVIGDENRRQRGTHFAQTRIVLDRSGKRKRDGRDILKEIRPDLQKTADALGVVKMEINQRAAGPPTGKAIEARLIGDDYEALSRISRETQAFLRKQKGVFGVKDDFTAGKEELLLKVDTGAVARAGISPAAVARSVRAAFDGAIATEIQRADKDEDIEVLVKLPESARGSPDTLDKIRITTPRGRLVPLSQLITRKKGTGYFVIPHSQGKRTITVTGDVDQDQTSSYQISAKLREFLNKQVAENRDIRWEFVGEEQDRIKSVASLTRAMAIACIVIYTLLATLMGSFALPVVIMSIIPFAFIGVFLTLLIHGLPLSMLVLIGLTGLMGVVVNNSILLVEAIVRLESEMPDLTLPERLIEAGRQRLRPIILTSVTTFFGVAPLGYGIGGREPFLEHVALTFGWGLLFTAIITLFLIPTFYALGANIGSWLKTRTLSSEIPPA